MASNLLKLPCQTIKPSNFPNPSFLQRRSLFLSFPISQHDQQQFQYISKPLQKSEILCSASSLSSYTPPTTKEAAILQAKTCLSTTLEKPLNNLRLAGKLKRQKQPRFRVEIPVIDDSTDSLTQLALEFFQNIPITRKRTQLNILLLWPNSTLTDSANKAFSKSISSHSIVNMNLSSILTNNPTINSADLAIFLAPETSQLKVMKTVSDSLSPKPVVVFNPKWGFEEESEFGELSSFVGSFEVVYSFMGLEVRGVISKRKGVVFKCVRDGVLSGEKWEIFVEEEEGELKVISRFKKRPSISEVENVLYNVMAVNSPITKSAKFLRDLVSNVTGKK
ncbi:Plant/F3H11-7 protein [Thalictrum thalictroides]|uniref:Plant/F3H11-7 protein n=1 Tax=Thalictrum thalictroides TaxID=46969 RepID=A0A7J6VKD8_THATH|nr:Plant/F3H11-7 protein [Thalictrum thalictroides]